MVKISLHEPRFKTEEFAELKKCFNTGWLSAGGDYVSKLEKQISKLNKIRYCSCLINGTAALQIALRSIGIQKGDEVLVPTITFISTINSIIYNNASPVFFDVNENFNINEENVINFLNKETFFKNNHTYNKKTKKVIKAIIIVHVFGNPVNFEKLFKTCKKKNIKIIEDAAESLGSKYIAGIFKNMYTGTIGDLGCYSFNGNKIISSGGGGAIVTNNLKLKKKIDYLISQSKDDSINFIHNDVGYNYKMTNLHASIGYSNIKKLKINIKKKKQIFNFYKNQIKNGYLVCADNKVNSNFWLNVIVLKNNKLKEEKIKKLINNKIEVRSVWFPNHLQKPFKKFQNYQIKKALSLVKKSICLPSSPNLKKNNLKKIVNLIND